MSKSKPTPGPWKFVKGLSSYSIQSEANSFPVNIVKCVNFDREANARLIAAAPEMLEALKRIIEGGCPSFAKDIVIAAIAKVEGRDDE